MVILARSRGSARKLFAGGQLPRGTPARCSLERRQSGMFAEIWQPGLTWASLKFHHRSPIIHEDASHRRANRELGIGDGETKVRHVQGALVESLEIVGIVKTSKVLKGRRHPHCLVRSNRFDEGDAILEIQLWPYGLEWNAW